MIKTTYISTLTLLICACGQTNPKSNNQENSEQIITTGPTTVKKIVVPKGAKLTYEEHFFKEGQQTRLMNEKNSRV